MADHRELPRLRGTAMNISVTPAHRAKSRTEISARHIDERLTKRGAPGLIANQRREDIALLQKDSTRDAHRFLPSAKINAASDQAAPVKAGEFILENPRLAHEAERFEVLFV